MQSLGLPYSFVRGEEGQEEALEALPEPQAPSYSRGGGVLKVANSNVPFNGGRQRSLALVWERVHGNTTGGTPPTAIGAITHDVGQM
jgi:hypothetical protein